MNLLKKIFDKGKMLIIKKNNMRRNEWKRLK